MKSPTLILVLSLFKITIAFAVTGVFMPPTINGSHDVLVVRERIDVAGAVGPESLAFDPSGVGPYTGVADGRILKLGKNGHWVEFAVTSSQRNECVLPYNPAMEHICGRPLGLCFHQKTGDLYIADAYLGLKVVGREGGMASSVVDVVEGQILRLTNDVDIDDEKDVIYFTDSSTVFNRSQAILSISSMDRTGKLMKYNITSKEVTVLARGLAFANGVSLSNDRSFVLISETTTCKILRYWLEGPNAGKHDTFAELPGFPDNIRRNSEGEFWVGLLPFDCKQPHNLLVGGKDYVTALKLSNEGKVLQVLEDMDGKTLKFVSEVEEKNGKLCIGSVLMPYIGIYSL